MKDETKLNALLGELLKTEESFTKNAQIIQFIFKALFESYPNEQIFEQYDLYLKRALPIYEKVYAQSRFISHNSSLNAREKIHQITALYSSELYTHSFSNFILFYRQFECWGGEVEYEKWVQKSSLFSSEIMKNVYEKYTPMIFIQRLPQLSMIIHECAEHTADRDVQSIDKLIRATTKEMNEKRIKIEIVSDISHLLNGEGNVDDQKKVVQLFIENQLYQDIELCQINEKVKKYFVSFSHEIFQNLCQRIEELKIKLSDHPSKKVAEFKEELTERLIRYLTYAKNECVVDYAMIDLAEAVLSETPLTSDNRKKLLLMREYADSFVNKK